MPRINRNKIGLIGRIDRAETMLDGQTVKTRTVYRMLVKRYGSRSVVCVDTLDYERRAAAVFARLLLCIVSCDDLVVLLSRGGRRALFPMLYIASKVFKKRVYHSLIGSMLAEDLKKNPNQVTYLNSFAVNWVESRMLCDELEKLGVRNARHMPNCKEYPPSCADDSAPPIGAPYRFCTLSRVSQEKGITVAAEAVFALNDACGISAVLDVYGPVDARYEDRLEAIVRENPFVSYRGCVPDERSIETVRDYDALLFPTMYFYEGMPGSVIDALAAGTPVIASRWKSYEEMLEDGVTGFGCEPSSKESLLDAIRSFALLDERDVREMRRNCLARSRRYAADEVFGEMARCIEETRRKAL